MKVVINSCHGGFGLSEAAYRYLIDVKGWTVDSNEEGNEKTETLYSSVRYGFRAHDERSFVFRSHPDVISAVEALGEAANGDFAELKVVEIPDGVECFIEEYDGNEWATEAHRTWG